MLQNIEMERHKNKITVPEMAARLGCSPKTYYNWVREATDIPASALRKMKLIFGAESIDYLLEK